MINQQQVTQVYSSLEAIRALAKEIEDVPNLGSSLWQMREIDKKCQVIRQHRDQISRYVGTGDVLRNTNVPAGMKVVNTNTAAAIQAHLNRIHRLAIDIEEVPNFGPSIWQMRQIDAECRQIAEHCRLVWALLDPSHT